METPADTQRKILIIEDEQSLIDALTSKLTSRNFHVIQAKNGTDGLKVALHQHPDMILLDILMPEMDGMMVLKKLREDTWGKTASVIILTNVEPNDSILEQINETQPTYYLIKSDSTLTQIAEKIETIIPERKVVSKNE